MMRWEAERQNPGYEKMVLWVSKRWKFSICLIRINPGTSVKMRVDPAPAGYEHHRLNITLKRSRVGMVLYEKVAGSNRFFIQEDRVLKFRPDVQRHLVTQVNGGRWWMLSIGWLRRANG
jgi:hypothetical protein